MRNISVAIVEDEEVYSKSLSEFLSRFAEENDYDLNIEVFSSSVEAAETFRGQFQILFLDIMMAGMTGMELAQAIRADPSLSSMKVYLFTAEVEMKDSFAKSGFNGILFKPANLESLRNILP